MILTWQKNTDIENSLIDFIQSALTTSSLELLDKDGIAHNIQIYAGRELNNEWNLPIIQIYFDSNPDYTRLEIGTNKRLKSWLIIIDIRTLLPGQETNLANWIEDLINDGVPIYNYNPNSLNPDVPAKNSLGHGRVDFITSALVPVFDNADKFDQNRYRIGIKIWLNKGELTC